ncbi:MAG: 16S rRNA (adenine(1518)-N(6)/adenine(1519)-N(6))-dimethyltransferase RsmA [Emergencia sp.]
MNLYAPSTIRDIRERHGFRFSKNLGQNFLTDKNIIDRIIEATEITDEDLVIEIGPGIGVLTAEAARLAKKVTAVEIDRNLIPVLNETLADLDNVEIINQDVLKTDLNRIIEESGCSRAKIIGNLPYYITTPIIMGILESHVRAESITIMMQKEVADRIKSGPGTKAYGALSVAVQYYCTVKNVITAPKEAFVPAPKVDSSVLRLDIRREPPVKVDDEEMFFRCVRAGFGQRRKTLPNSLMGLGTVTKEDIRDCLAACGIDEKRRAETLSLEEFAELANCFSKRE